MDGNGGSGSIQNFGATGSISGNGGEGGYGGNIYAVNLMSGTINYITGTIPLSGRRRFQNCCRYWLCWRNLFFYFVILIYMGLLNFKEDIIDLKLTDKGRELLSEGQLDFTYFAFSDEGVDYSGSFSLNNNFSR